MIILYLDNASSSKRSKYLANEISKVFGKARSIVDKRELLELAERKILGLLGVSHVQGVAISFVPNATYALNEIAYSLTSSRSLVRPQKIKKRIYISDSEHASNHLIWLKLSEHPITYLPIRDFNNWKLPDEESIFSFACTTNLEGISIPIPEINKKFYERKHLCIVDASQLFQYEIPNLDKSPIDYLVFTAHKCFGPNGIGIIYSNNKPIIGIHSSNLTNAKQTYSINWDALEGWINFMGVWEDMNTSGFCRGAKYTLNEYFVKNFPYKNKLLEFLNKDTRGSIFLLRVKDEDLTAHDYAFALARKGIIVRAGLSCAWLLGRKFDGSKIIRISLGPFNTTEDLRIFFETIEKISFEDCF